MKRLILGMNTKETVVVTCSCGKKFELRSATTQGCKKIVFDAPKETKIARKQEKTRLIEEGS